MWTVIVVLAGLALGCGAVDNAGGELVFDVVDHGARGDGITDDTKAFEAAWTAACGAKAPSASMVVPPQRSFLVGPVSFQGPCASERITVQIQGNIVAPPSTAANTWTSDCVQSAPTALKLVKCNNLEVSQLSSKDSPQMHIAILESSGVNVWGLNITAPGSSPNTDGVHIEQSQNVQVTNSRICTGDDCISMSSGSRFVTADGIECGPGHGVSIGSLGKNGDTAAVEFIDVKNVHFINTMNGARIKTWEGGQGYAKSISFTNIEFDNVDNPVLIDQFYRDRSRAVAISNVTYSNLKGTSSRATAVAFDCSDGGSCTDIHVESMNITGPGGAATVARCRNAQVAISGSVYPEIPCRS
ncbi:LOW QUALITY PROTEIN: probable polygalacturonase At3g15720 [Setaria italica]|uniref:LOW QUALITY PROTEIN: probable polygalacturonase At3g15720 n=1 Tax=Setaria italica TaxID=4555 RepID=UPI0006476616|nr:LOW QUALITY PROTEIN: probable polygalacturonase At3g15720 [Setaria italica]